MTKYSFPLGRVAEALRNLDPKIPLLTTIVVRESTGLPSSGIDPIVGAYLNVSTSSVEEMSATKRKAMVQQLWDEVFGYKDWPAVLARLGLTGDPKYDL